MLDPLLPETGQVPTDTAECGAAAGGAEAAGDLLLNFEHPKISFRLVVIKRNREIAQEGEHLSLPQPEAFEQVAGGRLFEPTVVVRRAGWRRVGGVAGRQEFLIARNKPVPLLLGAEGAFLRLVPGRWPPSSPGAGL